MTFRRIHEHLAHEFPVAACCAALGVSASDRGVRTSPVSGGFGLPML